MRSVARSWARRFSSSWAIDCFVGQFGGDADRGALECLADELGVGDGLRADPGDEGADLGTDFDQAVVAEAAERLADRGGLTPSRSPSSVSERRSPGANSPRTIWSRSAA